MKYRLIGDPNYSLISGSDVLPLSILETFKGFKRRGDLIVRDKDFPELYWVYGSDGQMRGSILLSANDGKALVIDDF